MKQDFHSNKKSCKEMPLLHPGNNHKIRFTPANGSAIVSVRHNCGAGVPYRPLDPNYILPWVSDAAR